MLDGGKETQSKGYSAHYVVAARRVQKSFLRKKFEGRIASTKEWKNGNQQKLVTGSAFWERQGATSITSALKRERLQSGYASLCFDTAV